MGLRGRVRANIGRSHGAPEGRQLPFKRGQAAIANIQLIMSNEVAGGIVSSRIRVSGVIQVHTCLPEAKRKIFQGISLLHNVQHTIGSCSRKMQGAGESAIDPPYGH